MLSPDTGSGISKSSYITSSIGATELTKITLLFALDYFYR